MIQWSLGVMLFAMLTAKLPFNGNSFEELSVKVTSLKISYPDHLDESLVSLFRSIFTRSNDRISLSSLSYSDWVMRGYATPPIDFLEFSNGSTIPKRSNYLPNPTGQTGIIID